MMLPGEKGESDLIYMLRDETIGELCSAGGFAGEGTGWWWGAYCGCRFMLEKCLKPAPTECVENHAHRARC